ncbi:thioesterase II family protein [Streptosporangium sp. CA-115845]|uniref:thioesterase II family protein n=1 Tax=Streptosporangium sp. CA-115845 TaxID=3240071 RepID=UPI003D8F4D1E
METNSGQDRVLVQITRPRQVDLDIVIFPGAGGGPGAFTGWSRLLPEGWRLAAVCLPAREHRADEDFADSIPAASRETVPAIASWRAEAVPVVYIGHSMGTWLALETALACTPDLLVPVACAPRAGPLEYDAPNMRALREITYEHGRGLGIDAEILEEIVARTATVMIGDIGMAAGYVPSPGRLSCDIVAYYATRDTVPCEPWSAYTSGRAESVKVEGDHHFVKREPQAVIEDLRGKVRERFGAEPPARRRPRTGGPGGTHG